MEASLSYTGAIRRMTALLIVVPNLVEVILVELTDETGEVAVLEVFWQDGFRKPFILPPGVSLARM